MKSMIENSRWVLSFHEREWQQGQMMLEKDVILGIICICIN